MTFSTGDVQITEFSILGLHGNKNIRLKLEDNTLILVGQNGTHKTTILTLFYSFLAGDVERLAKYTFDSLEMVINGKSFLYNTEYQNMLHSLWTHDELRKAELPIPYKVKQSFNESEISELSIQDLIAAMREEDSTDIRDLERMLPFCYKDYVFKRLHNALGQKPFQFFYFPTYRITEADSQIGSRNLLKGSIRFTTFNLCGMEDIQELWAKKTKSLKDQKIENETYLKNEFAEIAYDEDIYQNTSLDDFQEYSQDLINKVLERIKQDNQIKPKLKESLLTIHIFETNNSKVPKTLHIFKRYIESYQRLFELEKSLDQLCEACNRYLYSNEMVFDPTKLDVYIRNRKSSEKSPEQRIDLSQLSSGEKQLVSLFTHLYLSEGTQYFVIIDEPEISLSVEWQETFLEDIRNGTFCSGLFVATHSPFMFDNSLRKYAHGVGRFLEVVETSNDNA
jgi:hypothetical protein